jgi:hypothetical protein
MNNFGSSSFSGSIGSSIGCSSGSSSGSSSGGIGMGSIGSSSGGIGMGSIGSSGMGSIGSSGMGSIGSSSIGSSGIGSSGMGGMGSSGIGGMSDVHSNTNNGSNVTGHHWDDIGDEERLRLLMNVNLEIDNENLSMLRQYIQQYAIKRSLPVETVWFLYLDNQQRLHKQKSQFIADELKKYSNMSKELLEQMGTKCLDIVNQSAEEVQLFGERGSITYRQYGRCDSINRKTLHTLLESFHQTHMKSTPHFEQLLTFMEQYIWDNAPARETKTLVRSIKKMRTAPKNSTSKSNHHSMHDILIPSTTTNMQS